MGLDASMYCVGEANAQIDGFVTNNEEKASHGDSLILINSFHTEFSNLRGSWPV